MRYLFLCLIALFTFPIHSRKSTTKQRTPQRNFSVTRYKKHRRRNRLQQQTQEKQEIITTDTPFLKDFSDDTSLDLFLKNIEFTHQGIKSFFVHTLNKSNYAQEFLPHSFTHLQQFLSYAHKNNQPTEFVEGVIRLFHQKMKGCSYISAYAFQNMIDKVPLYIKSYCAAPAMPLWDTLKQALIQSFRTQFSFLKQDPLGFFEQISLNMSKQINKQIITPERLRSTTMRFLTSGIDKLAWSPHDQHEVWKSFKTIGEHIGTLKQYNIVPDEQDINELYWGLIERFCFFLDLTGSALSSDVCASMKQDLQSGKLAWLALEEQEEGLQTKGQRLAQAIIATEAKIQAYKKGILTEALPLHHS